LKACKLSSLAIGLTYASFAALTLFNWLATTLPLGLKAIAKLAWLTIPGDLGLSVSLLTVALLFLSSAYFDPGTVKGAASMLVGCIVGVAVLAMQLLVVAAGVADAALTCLAGEAAEYALSEGLLRPDVLLGLGPLALTPYSWRRAKSLVEAPQGSIATY